MYHRTDYEKTGKLYRKIDAYIQNKEGKWDYFASSKQWKTVKGFLESLRSQYPKHKFKGSMALKEHFDEAHAKEDLELHIDNTGHLYEKVKMPIVRNLIKKMKAGSFNIELAARAFETLVDAGAENYWKEQLRHDEEYNTKSLVQIFPKKMRKELAKEYADEFVRMYKNGELAHEGGFDKNAIKENSIMENKTLNAIHAAIKGNLVQFKEMVTSLINGKMRDAFDSKRDQVAQKTFSPKK